MIAHHDVPPQIFFHPQRSHDIVPHAGTTHIDDKPAPIPPSTLLDPGSLVLHYE